MIAVQITPAARLDVTSILSHIIRERAAARARGEQPSASWVMRP